jgi:hypothetical protein
MRKPMQRTGRLIAFDPENFDGVVQAAPHIAFRVQSSISNLNLTNAQLNACRQSDEIMIGHCLG